jgi:hypothetical protein
MRTPFPIRAEPEILVHFGFAMRRTFFGVQLNGEVSMTAFRASALRGGFRVAIAIASVSWLAGCTGFSQVYHFQSAPAADGVPNFFRVKVEGDAQTARARFLAGFYDERAVDLYFNEVKTGNGDIRKLFENNQKEPGDANTVIKPLTPDGARGSFVMIFSTNPKAVADTIGSFADSQLVAEALTNLLNKKEIEASRLLTATRGANDAVSTALADELAAIVPAAPADNLAPPSKEVLTRQYLRVLEVVSRHSGGPASFADIAAARAWLATLAAVR